MLGPIADIAPEVVHPTLGKTLGRLWREFDREAHHMERVELALGQ
jgi:7,8-dihydro-6-hydroxymethylpterin-pyrophosphokinase